MIKSPLNKKKKSITILQSLDIYGIDRNLETFIFASMLSGDPCMMIGKPGSAKTEIVKVIGQALNSSERRKEVEKPFSFQIYDASKLSFEDLVGYPDPKALMNGDKIEFIKTPLTIWGKDLTGFDEINRCSPEVQNNLFEIIRSRKCNGIDTGTKFIFGTMNPFGSVATNNLAGALVDRFTFFLMFDEFSSFSTDDKLKIIDRVGDVDSVGLRKWMPNENYSLDFSYNVVNNRLADAGDKITELLSNAANNYKMVNEEFGESFNHIIIKLNEELIRVFNGEKPSVQDEIKLSGRRCGMIKRALVCSRAVDLALSNMIGSKPISVEALVKEVFNMTIPLGIGSPATEAILKKLRVCIKDTVDNNWSTIHASIANDSVRTLIHSNNILERLSILSNNEIQLDPLVLANTWKSFKEEKDPLNITIYHLFGKVYPDKTSTAINVDSFILDKNSFIDKPVFFDGMNQESIDAIYMLAKEDKSPLFRNFCAYLLSYISTKSSTIESMEKNIEFAVKIYNNASNNHKTLTEEKKEGGNKGYLDALLDKVDKSLGKSPTISHHTIGNDAENQLVENSESIKNL